MIEKVSALHFDHHIGLFGDHEGKNNLLKIKEIKDLNIFQVAKFKKSSVDISQIKIDDVSLPLSNPLVSHNSDIRILWTGPDTWTFISENPLKEKITFSFNDIDFGITDLSHSRAAIQIQGDNAIDVLKKGSPVNFNEDQFSVNSSANTTYNGINILIDFISLDPKTLNIYSLRSFGGSFYHSITDSALEYGYEGI
jgi:sarcosine oxidase subunit gamma